MKVQSLAVIFAIILLPVIIILMYYIQAGIDTIALQTSYDTKLIDSTHDAMVSFELNTANENLSAVADSLRSIIDASTNVFFNTLATNLGMSNANREYIQNYIPAILYTLYDGYYIYSPTRVPTVLTGGDEKVVYVGDRGVTLSGEIALEDPETGAPTGKHVGRYLFDEDEYAKEYEDNDGDGLPDSPETEAVKSARQDNLYNLLPADRKYEFAQMLYENVDGSYSPAINPQTLYKQDYVLKSFMPYSARYLNEAGAGTPYDLTINYTLDNYLSVEGYIDKIYYSKTGYLIAENVVENIYAENLATGATIADRELLKYNEDTAEEICLTGNYRLSLKIKPYTEDGVTRIANPIELVYEPWFEDGKYLSAIELQEKLDRAYETNSDILLIQELEIRLSNLKAITYYVKSQIFSDWVYENLGAGGLELKGENISNEIADLNVGIYTSENDMDILHSFENDDILLFNSTINPEKQDSPFYSHKLNVIKNAIQYNLNLALSCYDIMAGGLDIQMPVLTDDEWDKILTNVSVVSFMQGFNCGMKVYNNYAISSSTNNELTVIPNEIYYTKRGEFNTADTSHLYHRIDCDELTEEQEYISFVSKEIKYDKIYDKPTQKYMYDHRNNGCYSCIIGGNYLKRINNYAEADEVKGYSDDIIISALTPNKQKEYFRALGKERQNLYKTNALTSSNGYEVLFTSTSNTSDARAWGNGNSVVNLPLTISSSKGINKIKEIEITIRDIASPNINEATASFNAGVNGTEIGENLVVNLGQATPQTMIVPVHVENTANLTTLTLKKNNPDDVVTCNVLSVRVIYE